MSDAIDQLRSTLKEHRQSITKTRLTVFMALQGKEPQTMNEVVSACEQQIDRASVYRTIALYEQLGIVQRLQIGWKYRIELSDAFHNHHHHLSCTRCGQTFPLREDNELEKRLKLLAQQLHFVMHGHQLEIQGLCNKCSKL